ncbi:hypothetical protein B0J11DRAFT_606326, partial [Dendryphion nanum]
AVSINSTLLVVLRDANATLPGTYVLQGYGIPYQTVDISIRGGGFPQLNSTADSGNFGGIVLVSAREYKDKDDWNTALNERQWQDLYRYQEAFGVRMVRLNAYPSEEFGVQATAGPFRTDVPLSIYNGKDFPTANIRQDAAMSTFNVTKYTAKVTNSSLARQFAEFGTSSRTTAAVINRFPSGREQQVWFTVCDPNLTSSTILSHAWIHWISRGLYLGFRRIYLNTQVDDVFVMTELYETGKSFRVKPEDLAEHVTWTKELNAKLPPGSNFMIELGHNGNGNIEAAVENDYNNAPAFCDPQEGIDYPAQIDGPPEYMKPIGTGKDLWDKKFKKYQWTAKCSQLDPLEVWLADKKNMNAFLHVSHTFTHEDETNATYADVVKEITWNQEWFKRIGFTDATSSPFFSPNGLIPPGITGLHNGDAIRAWLENGIKYAMGDNSRPILMQRPDRKSDFHPIVTNVKENGYAGAYIIGRFGTSIYYNCDLPECVNKEWKAIAKGSGNFLSQLQYEAGVNSNYLVGLRWDPYMFHQANMRVSDTPKIDLLGKNKKYSLLMAWTEFVLNQVTINTDWPIITLKHDDISIAIINRKTRDECLPQLSYVLSDDRKSITGVKVSARNMKCGTPIPVTVPNGVTDAKGATKEQRGKDPLTLWVSLGGAEKSYTLDTAIQLG